MQYLAFAVHSVDLYFSSVTYTTFMHMSCLSLRRHMLQQSGGVEEKHR